MSYSVLPHARYESANYALVSIRKDDMESIRQWRNVQIAYLRQKDVLTEEQQSLYWEQVLIPSFSEKNPKQILFSFLLNDQLIGYGGLTHINWFTGDAEVSFLLNPERTVDHQSYELDLQKFLHLLESIAFDELHLKRLLTEIYPGRPWHTNAFDSYGFQRYKQEGECIFQHYFRR